jgi:hypothetical protein
MENLTTAGESGKALSANEIREVPNNPQAPQGLGVSQKPLSQAPLAAGVEVGRRKLSEGVDGSAEYAPTGAHEGAASPNPIRGGAFQGRELPHERAARLLATWTRYMDAGHYEGARRWVIALSDEDADLFLEAHGRRLKERELAGVDFFD